MEKYRAFNLFFGVVLLTIQTAICQEESKGNLKLSGYLETYYGFDFGNPANHQRPSFIYSFNRHNEFAINLGLLKASYSTDLFRANLALMTGTYANANLAHEPGTLKHIYEANTGIRLSPKANLWLDAGVFSSHIGFESAIGKNCWSLTRSLQAENSPYYESGLKISFTTNDNKWFISGLILNGWQRIQRIDGQQMPAFGHQITYTPTSDMTINSSSFFGLMGADSVSKMRYFHNFYGIWQIREWFGLSAGFDIGAQQKAKGFSQYNIWFSPQIIARMKLSERLVLAARGEYYSDENQAIIHTGTEHGFQTLGWSLNLDYRINNQVWVRFEGRQLKSRDSIFQVDGISQRSNFLAITTMAISF